MNIHVRFSSVSDHWATPREVYKALDDEFHFDFDSCLMEATDNGLATLFPAWTGKRAFANCQSSGPYIAEWLLERGSEADVAVFLIPAPTDKRWFHENVLPRAKEIRFIRKGPKFGNAVNGAPFPSMIVIFKKRELSK